MSVYDDKIATQHTQASTDEQNVTHGYRDLFGGLAVAGIVLCFTPAIAAGIGMVLMFGVLWLCLPVVEQAEQECIEDTRESGDGVGKFIKTVAMMLCFGVLAIVLAVLVMMVTLGGA